MAAAGQSLLGGGRARRSRGSRAAIGAILALAAASLAGCDALQVIEQSPSAVTVRYDGFFNGLDEAKPLAQKACAASGKTAKLRKVYYEGLGMGERYAHFDCV
jgi:hypothetical protein